MATLLIVLFYLTLAIAGTIMIHKSKPKWQVIYFKTILMINDGDSDTKIVKTLMIKYKFDLQKATSLLNKAKDEDQEAFQDILSNQIPHQSN